MSINNNNGPFKKLATETEEERRELATELIGRKESIIIIAEVVIVSTDTIPTVPGEFGMRQSIISVKSHAKLHTCRS